jgi:8-oxo-dGTP diphosphatase
MRPISVAIAIVENAGRFLVGVRQAGQALAGLAEFPGGKVKSGETVDEAVCREVREEAGLAVRPTAWRREIEYAYPHGLVHLTFVRCELISDGLLIHPNPPFQWVDAEDLMQLDFPAANGAILRELIGASLAARLDGRESGELTI